MKKAFRKDRELLEDLREPLPEEDRFRLSWLGQSGFLIRWMDRCLLLDPYLSDSLTVKYARTDKPHERITELVIDPSCLDFIDVVTSSHNHTDHLDGETLSALLAANPEMDFLVPRANRQFASDRLEISADRITPTVVGETVQVAGFEIHTVPAAHEDVELDDAGDHRFVGYVVQFGQWTIYHSGDTMLYDGMKERLRSWNIDLALLPINGRAPERRVAGNLRGREAAKLAVNIGASVVVPCHYDMFEFNTATTDEFLETCTTIGQDHVILRNGESVIFPR